MPLLAHDLPAAVRNIIAGGAVIPAHPLALTAERKFDERRQRALYPILHRRRRRRPCRRRAHDAVRDPRGGLFRPVLALARETARGWASRPVAMIAGRHAADRPGDARGRHRGRARLSRRPPEPRCHARRERGRIDRPLRGGRGAHPAVRLLSSAGRRRHRICAAQFWRRFAALDNVIAIKIAPFNRYRTCDVMRGVVEAGARTASRSIPATTTTSCSTS